MMNTDVIKKCLKTNAEAAIISSETNRRYFTEFPSSDGYLVATKKRAVFFTDSRYIEAASLKCRGCETSSLSRFSEEIASFLRENGIKKVFLEKERLTVAEFEAIKNALPFCEVTPSEKLEKVTDESRAIKNEYETESVIKAQRIAEAAFDSILGFIKPGVTEREIGLELDYFMLRHGAEALSFETIAITGAKTSMPHGVPDENKVRTGDFVTLDYGAVVNGYHSDMTRTVAVGKPSDEQKKVYDTVLEAQLRCLDILKSGISGKKADSAARNVIKKAGYGEFFRHSTGHGVGVEIHEKPNLSPSSKYVLRPGNIVTVEPGIYIPGRFGVRIEDMALITETGCENLTRSPKELIML